MTKKILRSKKIGVLLGGVSSEREVSLRSGGAVLKALKALGYDCVAIDAAGDLCSDLRKKRIDIAFIALHGGHGENGAVQGLLEVMNVPYTGSGVLSSALAMDKEASKKIFMYHDIPVPPFKIVTREPAGVGKSGNAAGLPASSAGAHYSLPRFPLPWVIKPASEGSSVGVEIVKGRKDLLSALTTAFSYGDRVVIEKFIKGKEVQIAVLNDKVLGGVEVRPSLEFYSYEAKYTAGLTDYIFPPELSMKTYTKAKEAALSAHKALGCSGATRVDLIVDPSQKVYVLEVNTIPGMTETSLLPKIAQNAGLGFPALIEEILGGVAGGL